MRLNIVLLLLSVLILSCQSNSKTIDLSLSTTKLYPILLDGKGGFIDERGQIKIAPQFAQLSDFSEGLAAVYVGNYGTGKWGYINTEGSLVINPQFDGADQFKEGLALVRIGGTLNQGYGEGKSGYIDKAGNFVINPQFDWAYGFQEGLAKVMIGESWGYIDKTGKYVINPQFKDVPFVGQFGFNEGLTAAKFGDKYGFINKQGEIVINPQFDAARDFSDGVAKVGLAGLWGYIDKKGTYIINPQFESSYGSGDFNDGLAVALQNGLHGYINKTGKFVINPQFEKASDFNNGYAQIGMNEKWGMIDRTGNIVVPIEYEFIWDFTNGLARVKKDDDYAYINMNGDIIWSSEQNIKSSEQTSSVENRTEATGHENIQMFVSNLRKAIAAGDKSAVADLVHFPLVDEMGDNPANGVESLGARNKEEFFQKFDQIFSSAIIININKNKYRGFQQEDDAFPDVIERGEYLIEEPNFRAMPAIKVINGEYKIYALKFYS